MAKFLLSALALGGSLTYAADFKLGYIDVAKIFATSKPAVAIQDSLSAKFAPRQQELQKMNEVIAKEQSSIKDIAKKAPSRDKLSSADRTNLAKLETKFRNDQGIFQQQYMLFQQEAQHIHDQDSAFMLKKVNDIVKDISDKGGYDLVLTSNQLVYAKAKYDLTDQVIEQLNKVDSAAMLKQLKDAQSQPLPNAAAGAGVPSTQQQPTAVPAQPVATTPAAPSAKK